MFSCLTPRQEKIQTDETDTDIFLSHIDSVLNYADSEIDNIVHSNRESELEHKLLIGEIKRLNNEIYNRNRMIDEIMSDSKSTIDSLTKINLNQKIIISQNHSMIEILENKNEKLVQLNIENKYKIDLLEDTIYNMQNSMKSLNEKLMILLNYEKNNRKIHNN